MRLLWVENHAGFVQVAGRQFLSGHELTVASSVAAAKAALATGEFDAVLVDYDLDDGKGTELVEHVCRHAVRPAIVAASSHERGNTALLAAGADAVCPKRTFAEIGAVLSSLYNGIRKGIRPRDAK
jgi:DNA-binding NarL/FixJ family response regulator